MTVICLSTSTTNTIRNNRKTAQAFTIRHSCQNKESVKPFLGSPIWHRLLKMHFGASQHCYPERERSQCNSFGRWSHANLGSSSPPPFERNWHPWVWRTKIDKTGGLRAVLTYLKLQLGLKCGEANAPPSPPTVTPLIFGKCCLLFKSD